MTRWPRGRGRLPGEFKGSSEGLSSRSIGMRLPALPSRQGRASYSMGLILGARGGSNQTRAFPACPQPGLDIYTLGFVGSLPVYDAPDWREVPFGKKFLHVR
ncbi:hypothetical protein LY76DRAFT_589890 [Colletotrichum caudatum]|nr:hypothetical protein LY76DRAFT_589890 [Colletotrichum caudatum]